VILPLDNACFTIGITAVNCSAIKPNPNEPQSDKQTLTAGEHWQIALTLPVPFKRSPIVIVQSKVLVKRNNAASARNLLIIQNYMLNIWS
jgi:hypothetical protein